MRNEVIAAAILVIVVGVISLYMLLNHQAIKEATVLRGAVNARED